MRVAEPCAVDRVRIRIGAEGVRSDAACRISTGVGTAVRR